jgi:hypothetical protein
MLTCDGKKVLWKDCLLKVFCLHVNNVFPFLSIVDCKICC